MCASVVPVQQARGVACRASGDVGILQPNDGKRLGAVGRLFYPPAPGQPLKAHPAGLQTGDEIDGASTRPRPGALAHGQRLQGEYKIIAAILERPVIQKMLSHLGLDP
jgi:hypothetical protein